MKKLISLLLIALFLSFGLFFTDKYVYAAVRIQPSEDFSVFINNPIFNVSTSPAVYKPGDNINFQGNINYIACHNGIPNLTINFYVEQQDANGVKSWGPVNPNTGTPTPLCTTTASANLDLTSSPFNLSCTLPATSYNGLAKIRGEFLAPFKGGYIGQLIIEKDIRISTAPTAPTVSLSKNGSLLTASINSQSTTADAYNSCANPSDCPPLPVGAGNVTAYSQTGTVKVTAGNNTVTGSGTNFTKIFIGGDNIVIPAYPENCAGSPADCPPQQAKTITRVNSNTSLTVSGSWTYSSINYIPYKANGHSLVTGSGTNFSALSVGDKIVTDDGETHTITSINGSANLRTEKWTDNYINGKYYTPVIPYGLIQTRANNIKVYGSGTKFTKTFKAGDQIAANRETHIVASNPTSDTYLETTTPWAKYASNLSYTHSDPDDYVVPVFYDYKWYKNGILQDGTGGTHGTINLTHTDRLTSPTDTTTAPTYSNTVSNPTSGTWKIEVTPTSRAGLQIQNVWPTKQTWATDPNTTDWTRMRGTTASATIVIP